MTLPDYVYFNHEIHVNKGIGCASCHGRVDQMPLMYMENSLQMEWCLDCHRNPAKNLRPTAEIYNMAWAGPSSDKPVYCANTGKPGPTAQSVSCTTTDPGTAGPEVAMLQVIGMGGTSSDVPPGPMMPASYQKFTSQEDLGHLFDGAVPHSPAQRDYELRDMPSMKKTGNREQGTVNSGVELVTADCAGARATYSRRGAGEAGGQDGQALLEEPGRVGGDAGLPRDAANRNSRGRQARASGWMRSAGAAS